MRRIVAFIIVSIMAIVSFGQDYSYTLKKTMSPSVGNSDYSFWKFPVSSIANKTLVRGDTMDITIAVDLAKDNPAVPSLELKFANVSESTDSLFLSGTVKGSQFHLLTQEPATGLELGTITSTAVNMSTTDPYSYVIADSLNSSGFVIPKTGVAHLRSILYSLRLIPRGTSDTVRVTGINFKSWINAKY
jgi:hypothetical protein